MEKQQMRTGLTSVVFCLGALLASLGAYHFLSVTDQLPMTAGELHALVEGGLSHGDWEDVRRGIRKGANPDAFSGASPHWCLLCRAAKRGDMETVRLLREKSSDTTLESSLRHHRRLIINQIMLGNTEMVKILLCGGREDRLKWEGKSPLHVAIESGQLEIVRALLAQNRDNNLVDTSWLASIKDPEDAAKMVELLQRNGVTFLQYYPYC